MIISQISLEWNTPQFPVEIRVTDPHSGCDGQKYFLKIVYLRRKPCIRSCRVSSCDGNKKQTSFESETMLIGKKGQYWGDYLQEQAYAPNSVRL